MNFYDTVLNSIASGNLKNGETVFKDIFYFIAAMEKQAEHPGISFYKTLKKQFYLLNNIEQDEIGGAYIPDFCDDMVKHIENRYIEALRDGNNATEVASLQDFLKSHPLYGLFAKSKYDPPLQAFIKSDSVVTTDGVFQSVLPKKISSNSNGLNSSISSHALYFLYELETSGRPANPDTFKEYAELAGLIYDSFRVTYYRLRPAYRAIREKGPECKIITKKTFQGAILIAEGNYSLCGLLKKDMKRLFK